MLRASRERNVVDQGEGLKRAHDLLGEGQSGTDAAVDGPAGHVLAAEDHASALRAHDAGDDAHQGGLARAVGADETEKLTLVHLERDVFEGNHSAESHGDVLDVQKGHRIILAGSHCVKAKVTCWSTTVGRFIARPSRTASARAPQPRRARIAWWRRRACRRAEACSRRRTGGRAAAPTAPRPPGPRPRSSRCRRR